MPFYRKQGDVKPYRQMQEACRADQTLVGLARDAEWHKKDEVVSYKRYGTIPYHQLSKRWIKKRKNLYEMTQGHNRPIKMLVDLDGDENTPHELADQVIEAYRQGFRTEFGLENIRVIKLKSEGKKFSYHIIFCVWFDNWHESCHNFGNAIAMRHPELLPIIDVGLWSTWRQIRMVWCEKINSGRPLIMPEGCTLADTLLHHYGTDQPTEVLTYAAPTITQEVRRVTVSRSVQLLQTAFTSPDDWQPGELQDISPESLLRHIYPNNNWHVWFRISLAYRRCGGDYQVWQTHSRHPCVLPRRQRRRSSRMWDNLGIAADERDGLGFAYLLEAAGVDDERFKSFVMSEAYGLSQLGNIELVTTCDRYLQKKKVFPVFDRNICTLLKGFCGCGKSTILYSYLKRYEKVCYIYCGTNKFCCRKKKHVRTPNCNFRYVHLLEPPSLSCSLSESRCKQQPRNESWSD